MEVVGVDMNLDFWKHKRVFITGHTGFKGSWMALWLHELGSIVRGYSLSPNTIPSLFEIAELDTKMESVIGDVTNLEQLTQSLVDFGPEIVIHMAAQPLVRASYRDPVGTFQTNVMGTVNIFEAVKKCDTVRSVVNVTTDKCYENKEWLWGYRENEAMGGYDPYSSSKGCSELVTSAYRRSFFDNNSKVSLASARAGNVIGGGDWAEDRLIPDAIRAFNLNQPVLIRNPLATRPWQHVLEPISGYLALAEKLYLYGDKYAEGWNFGPYDSDVISVGAVLEYLVKNWHQPAEWVSDGTEQPHEARLLKLDISKANAELKWKPLWTLEKSLSSIIDWYSAYSNGEDMAVVTLNQIKEYQNAIRG